MISSLQERCPIVVVVPAWNEEGAIAGVVRDVRSSVPDALVLVIDDCSRDQTAKVAEQAGARVVRLPAHVGLGACLRAGYRSALTAGCTFLIRVDGDGQHDAGDIPRMLRELEQGRCDVAVGSRFVKPTGWKSTLPRAAAIALFRQLLRPLLGQTVHDPTSGFIGLNRRALEIMAASAPVVYPEIGALITARRHNLTVREVSSRMRPRLTGCTSFTTRRSVHYALCVLAGILLTSIRSSFLAGRTSGREFESE